MAWDVPLDRQWQYLEALRTDDGDGHFGIPPARPADDVVRAPTLSTLEGLKGDGGAARLLESCAAGELPATIIGRQLGACHAHHGGLAAAAPQDIENPALLATWGRGVNVLSRALTGNGINKSIPHRVMIDEASVLLSSRMVAFLMEPRHPEGSALLDLADALELAASVYRARGGDGNLAQAQRFAISANESRIGKAARKRRLLEISRCTGRPARPFVLRRTQARPDRQGRRAVVGPQLCQVYQWNRACRTPTPP